MKVKLDEPLFSMVTQYLHGNTKQCGVRNSWMGCEIMEVWDNLRNLLSIILNIRSKFVYHNPGGGAHKRDELINDGRLGQV